MEKEPGYITELKKQIGGVQEGVNETEKAIVRIDTTLAQNLPQMKEDLQALNGSVREHDIDIALQKQAHDSCPARKAVLTGNGLGESRSQWMIDLTNNKTRMAVGGSIVGIPAILFFLLEIARLAAQHFWGT